jgi:hypothetical protein
MKELRYLFLQKMYITLLAVIKKNEDNFFECRNSIERLYNYYRGTYNPTIVELTKDFDKIEFYCNLPNKFLNFSIIADILYVSDLVLNTWNNTEKKKKQQQL